MSRYVVLCIAKIPLAGQVPICRVCIEDRCQLAAVQTRAMTWPKDTRWLRYVAMGLEALWQTWQWKNAICNGNWENMERLLDLEKFKILP